VDGNGFIAVWAGCQHPG